MWLYDDVDTGVHIDDAADAGQHADAVCLDSSSLARQCWQHQRRRTPRHSAQIHRKCKARDLYTLQGHFVFRWGQSLKF